MYAFRDAFEAGDAGKRLDERVGGERVIPGRGTLKRSFDEAALKRNLVLDLLALMNTIDLDSALDLTGLDFVRRSILNFGLRDIAHLTSEERGVDEIAETLSQALLLHEPRLDRASLHVERQASFDEVNQRIRFNVSAEMSCKPLDIPIEFVAEIDVGSGKVQLTRLPVPA
ncbi:GPW/gp25 family protein [Propylenella binzhouense]|nr:GPW/gp25 family protein [Propylenella binzhouense]